MSVFFYSISMDLSVRLSPLRSMAGEEKKTNKGLSKSATESPQTDSHNAVSKQQHESKIMQLNIGEKVNVQAEYFGKFSSEVYECEVMNVAQDSSYRIRRLLDGHEITRAPSRYLSWTRCT
jgi:hypothetical protein